MYGSCEPLRRQDHEIQQFDGATSCIVISTIGSTP